MKATTVPLADSYISFPSLLCLVLTMLRLMDDNWGILGVNVGHLWHKPDLIRG